MSATILFPYYRNRTMLQKQLFEMATYRPDEKLALTLIIVDDGSPLPDEALSVVKAHGNIGFTLRLFRIHENKPWNQDGARNLAMKHVMTEWALLTDVDHILKRDQVGKFLSFVEHKAQPNEYYLPDREEANGLALHSHANSYVMRREDFWHMGGYDEDFAGVYGSDGNFRKCMKAGLRERATHTFMLTRYTEREIADANTRDWGRKDSSYHRSNFVAIEAKSRGPAYKAIDPLRFNWSEVAL